MLVRGKTGFAGEFCLKPPRKKYLPLDLKHPTRSIYNSIYDEEFTRLRCLSQPILPVKRCDIEHIPSLFMTLYMFYLLFISFAQIPGVLHTAFRNKTMAGKVLRDRATKLFFGANYFYKSVQCPVSAHSELFPRGRAKETARSLRSLNTVGQMLFGTQHRAHYSSSRHLRSYLRSSRCCSF